MVKTEYIIVASGLSRITNKENRLEVAAFLSLQFTLRDKKFDRSRFFQSANLWPCEFCEVISESKVDADVHYGAKHYHEYDTKQKGAVV